MNNGGARKRANVGSTGSGSRASKVGRRAARRRRSVDSDSSGSDPAPEPTAPASPPPEESRVKLPEELLKSFYKPAGALLIAGLVSWDLVAKRESNPQKLTHPNLYTFHRFTDRLYRLIVSSCSAGHSVLISENGEAYTFGRNTCGQLGFGDTKTRDIPEPVSALQGLNIIHAAVGRHHTLFVTDTGTVYACGDNKSGQCGVGNNTPQLLTPTIVRYNGAPIVKAGCGAEFSMILDIHGGLHSFGLPEYGQLDGKYFVTSTKMSYHFETTPKAVTQFVEKSKDGHVTMLRDVAVVEFSCGNNHTVAIDSRRRAFSWGFGGFGRLGHAAPRDEPVPRLLKYFETQGRGLRAVYCGSTYSLALSDTGGLFLFGQTKRTGEANMYPKPVQDLAGWNIRCVATGNTSIVIAADDSLIAWGVSPTYGELGTGELKKSCARPSEVHGGDGLGVTQATAGYSHSLLLADAERVSSLPTFTPRPKSE
ncbi:hypothetical protein ACJJTC_000620 [Scirpophaga incertulas]